MERESQHSGRTTMNLPLIHSFTAQLSLGGAFVRMWRKEVGLSVEIPSCVAIEQESRAVVAVGEEAQQLEGREPKGVMVVRPFFADQIVDRVLLRGLLMQALAQDRERLPNLVAQNTAFLGVQVALPATMTALHRRWFARTLREVGLITAPIVDSFTPIARAKTQRARGMAVVAVLDVGFSAARLVVYLGDTPILTQSWSEWSLSSLCQRVTELEERVTHLRFSPSTFYGQEWSLQHAGFDLQKHEAVFSILQKKTLEQSFHNFGSGLAESVQNALLQGEPNTLAQLSHHGIVLIGGGATIPYISDHLKKVTHLSTELHKNPLYAETRFS